MKTISYSNNVKARKDHACDFCGFKINKGETYIKSTHVYDGIYDWRTHADCGNLASKLNMYEDADEGVTQDMFMETVRCKFLEIDNSGIKSDFKHHLDRVLAFFANDVTNAQTDNADNNSKYNDLPRG